MQAIREAGYTKPTEAWRANQRALGISQDLMISNANGHRPISRKAAEKYAEVFGRTAGWYLYGEAGQTSAPANESPPSTQKVSDPKEIRKLLGRIDGLTTANIKVLLAAIEGFQLANDEQPSQSQRRDQSESANRPRVKAP